MPNGMPNSLQYKRTALIWKHVRFFFNQSAISTVSKPKTLLTSPQTNPLKTSEHIHSWVRLLGRLSVKSNTRNSFETMCTVQVILISILIVHLKSKVCSSKLTIQKKTNLNQTKTIHLLNNKQLYQKVPLQATTEYVYALRFFGVQMNDFWWGSAW